MTFDDDRLIELTARGWNQAIVAVRRLHAKGQTPTATEIAREAKLDRRVAIAALDDLHEHGFITETNRGQLKAYLPASPSQAPTPPREPSPSTESDSENGIQIPSCIAESDNGNGERIRPALSESVNEIRQGEQESSTVPVSPAPVVSRDAQAIIPEASQNMSSNGNAEIRKLKTKKRASAPASAPRKLRAVADRFDPASLPEREAEFWLRLIRLRWEPDTVPPEQALRAAEVARFLVADRDATFEQFDAWVTWWWRHGLGKKNGSQPYPANVKTDWDTPLKARAAQALALVASPVVIESPQIRSAIGGAEIIARQLEADRREIEYYQQQRNARNAG